MRPTPSFLILGVNRMSKKEEEQRKEELKKFKKSKPLISKGALKRITGVKTVDSAGCYWFDEWINQLVRERSYPPQLKSDDFYSLLGKYFDGKTILEILEKARREFRQSHPLCEPVEETDTLEWLIDVLRADPNALIDLPPNYLG
jgi:hypothetical protein